MLSTDHVVIGFFVNVLNPPRNNHRIKAERIRQIYQELCGEFRVKKYDIVGHSIGGKIALLAAALYDEEGWIRNIVALDPVDQSPSEFTNEILSTKDLVASAGAPPQNPFKDGDDDASAATSSSKRGRRKNLSLETTKADITLTFTDTGYWIGNTRDTKEQPLVQAGHAPQFMSHGILRCGGHPIVEEFDGTRQICRSQSTS